MTTFIIVSLVVSFFLSRHLWVGVSTGWIFYGISSLFLSDSVAAFIGIAVFFLGIINTNNNPPI